jgi:DNA-nicking Smr family endonuclease
VRRKHDNDSELFSNAMQDVKPIKPHNLAERPSARHFHNHKAQPQRISDLEESDAAGESGFARLGIQKTVLRRLRNGQIPVEAELDLHGCTVAEAEHQLKLFLRDAQATGRQRAVRVIHGKGLGSPEGKPVLKAKVSELLRRSDAVLAFCTAELSDGGSGAVRVLLKKR